MNRIIAGIGVAAGVLVTSVTAASAAPDNKNTDSLVVDCDEPLGTIEVSVVSHDQNDGGSAAFASDGQVLVVKQFESTADISVTLLDAAGDPASDPVALPHESFEKSTGANGQGHAGKLVACEFADTFSEVFALDADAAAFFNEVAPAPFDWADHIGDDVLVAGTVEGTAHVKVVGGP